MKKLIAILLVFTVGAGLAQGRFLDDPRPVWKVCDPATTTATPPDSGWANGGCVHGCGAPYCRGWLEEYAIKAGACVPSEEESNCKMQGTFTGVAFKYKCRSFLDSACPEGQELTCYWGLIANSGAYVNVPDCVNY